ncbi:MAG: 1,4-alpha-glucan branching enzyme, partial [Geodermatophilaceae bacterium]|nr:1,4-alpha-glucan branching enzyme [Geodermatophilaceae bacterium]
MSTPPPPAVDAAELSALLAGTWGDPHAILGAHPDGEGTVIRTLRPEAEAVTAVVGDRRIALTRIHDGGVFAGRHGGPAEDYRLEVTHGGDTHTVDDPYRWLPTLGEVDRHLIAEGRHERLWDVLGAHVRSYDT